MRIVPRMLFSFSSFFVDLLPNSRHSLNKWCVQYYIRSFRSCFVLHCFFFYSFAAAWSMERNVAGWSIFAHEIVIVYCLRRMNVYLVRQLRTNWVIRCIFGHELNEYEIRLLFLTVSIAYCLLIVIWTDWAIDKREFLIKLRRKGWMRCASSVWRWLSKQLSSNETIKPVDCNRYSVPDTNAIPEVFEIFNDPPLADALASRTRTASPKIELNQWLDWIDDINRIQLTQFLDAHCSPQRTQRFICCWVWLLVERMPMTSAWIAINPYCDFIYDEQWAWIWQQQFFHSLNENTKIAIRTIYDVPAHLNGLKRQ